MNELLAKLSSYNLFNYLLPGILFVVLAEFFTGYSFGQENLLFAAFVYYFIGMIVSRIGSLLIEPFLRRIRLLEFADYSDFVSASQKDHKLEILSEVNNTYRTLLSLVICLWFLKIYEAAENSFTALETGRAYVLLGALLLMFLFAYRKQTNYITKRIKTILQG